ncbi:MAG: hypothetical protein SOR73_11720 [Romboutsia timonensis]|uniref:hypothetical protein n=1 Tax=Romboutsia timonensis TaxID=1776391 RepID=UPI002A76567D|nr:hypothetical protein [Romboutsia timonensis]MDY3002317.1 hypothetical protein [Romboutsia timonensis]
MEKILKTNLHRWDIAHKGHCKWYYVDHEKETVHLFNQKHDLNMETELEYIFGYHKNHKCLVDYLNNKPYNIIVYESNENNLYDEVLVNPSYYIDKGYNIHLEK